MIKTLDDVMKLSTYKIENISESDLNQALLIASRNSAQRINRLDKSGLSNASIALNSESVNLKDLRRLTTQKLGMEAYKNKGQALDTKAKQQLLRSHLKFLRLKTSTVKGVKHRIKSIKESIGVDVTNWTTDQWRAYKKYIESKLGTQYDSATEMAEFDRLVEDGIIDIYDDQSIIDIASGKYEVKKKQEEEDILKQASKMSFDKNELL